MDNKKIESDVVVFPKVLESDVIVLPKVLGGVMDKKKKTGRPSKGDNARVQVVAIAVSMVEKAMIASEASKEGKSISAFLREYVKEIWENKE